MSAVFDLAAVRQWHDFVLPTDRTLWPALMAQILSDVDALCAYVVELEDKLAAAEADRDEARRAALAASSR